MIRLVGVGARVLIAQEQIIGGDRQQQNAVGSQHDGKALGGKGALAVGILGEEDVDHAEDLDDEDQDRGRRIST